MINLLELFAHILEPMRRPEPTRLCPLVPADDPVLQALREGAERYRGALRELADAEPEAVQVDLATFRRIRLEMRDA